MESPWAIEQNPTTLEWLVQSPPAFHTFGELPTIKETQGELKTRKEGHTGVQGRNPVWNTVYSTLNKIGMWCVGLHHISFVELIIIFQAH